MVEKAPYSVAALRLLLVAPTVVQELGGCMVKTRQHLVQEFPLIPGRPINACGPTTSKRMDTYAPTLYDAGVGCVIGKGKVGEAVKAAIVRNGAIYFGAVGGAGALIAKSVKSCTLVAYPELLAEAVYRLEVEDFPAYVAVDTEGGDIYELGPKTYRTD